MDFRGQRAGNAVPSHLEWNAAVKSPRSMGPEQIRRSALCAGVGRTDVRYLHRHARGVDRA
jgi:hypothetical protein